MKLNKIHHVAVICSDYAKSKHFYTDVLGMKIMSENYRKERDSWKADCWLDDNYTIELFSFPNPPARPSYPEAAGLRHLAFEVDNLLETIDELDSKGIVHDPIRTDEYTGKRFVFFNDPDGLPIELYEKYRFRLIVFEKMQQINIQYYNSPCGELILASVGDDLCLCDWNKMPCAEHNKNRLTRYMNADFKIETSLVLEQTKLQLDEYFLGTRRSFEIPLYPVGTDFQKKVWSALLEIPYGETRSYKDIAQNIGNPKGSRAVAGAIGVNGISILIPCHRVIGSNRSLTGFAGGLEAKRILLELETE